jgi:WS/DGAT/MGAT family acyltransferase
MHKLGLTDASFLYFETPATPMNIASVQLLEAPHEGFFDELVDYLEPRIALVPFMKKRLKSTPFGLDEPVWVDDPHFVIDNHVKRVRLPKPGTWRQLETLVARLHEAPFDRSRSLWCFYYIEGLETGQVAWYCKYHHACIDGMAGQAIIDMLFSRDPKTDPPPAETARMNERSPDAVDLLFDAARNLISQTFSFGKRIEARSRSMTKLAQRWLAGEAGLGAMLGTAPRTPFNAAISPYRAWAAGTLPLREMKALAKARKVSLNDVLMAVCGGGIRSYLLRKNLLPEKPLRAGVPVSLRKPGDASMRNQVTMLFATLATDLTDPLERLAAIKASVDVGKGVVDDSAGLDMSDLHIPGLGVIGFGASRLMEGLRIANFVDPFVNVVISNVRGPAHTMYLHGARMCSHFPVSIPAHGVAMNVTVQSYGDRLDLGVTACLEAVPDVADLRDDLVNAWSELRDAWTATLPAQPMAAHTRAA